jgi:aspartyl/asparaginyl beta-hydroxylase (cupin superfamily)
VPSPESAQRIVQSAQQAMAEGKWTEAQALLRDALAQSPNDLRAWLSLAATQRQLNDVDAAFAALREVLKRDSRNFHALLMTGNMLEKLKLGTEAAEAYAAAIANAPPDLALDEVTRLALQRARTVRAAYAQQAAAYVREQIASTEAKCTAAERRRVDGFIQTTLRMRERFQQNPSHYYYPGLPSIEFYGREEFAWLGEFEAATPAVQAELATIAREDAGEFTPYIHYPDHAPLDQWRELNYNPRWSSFHFFDKGVPIEAHCQRAPAVMAAIAKLPQPRLPMRSPAAMFSVLQPKTRIPPHTGVSNFRLVVHLPLVVPPQCYFRVGGETREWRVGEAWVFDDTIEHAAANDSDQVRTIFICDIWNPRLSPDERQLITEVLAATDKFTGVQPPAQI